MYPSSPSLVSKGPFQHPFFPSPWQAQARAEILGIKSSLKTKVRFSFSKEAAKSNWRSPRPGWRAGTPGQDSSFGLRLLIYWFMEGQSDPHFLTVPYEAGMNPLTLPSFGRKKSWADVLKPSCLRAVPCTCWQKPLGHQRALWHQLIPQRPLSPKIPGNSSEGPATTANRHKDGNDPENGNYVFLLTPSCH